MADFSFLSDTDDSAVEDLLSQTQDLCVLQQLSAINCSAFTDSVLPSDLESRFRKLKSFPAAKSDTRSASDSNIHAKSKSELGFSPKSSQSQQRLPAKNRSRINRGSGKYVSSSSSGEIDEIGSAFDSKIHPSLHSGDAKSCDEFSKENLKQSNLSSRSKPKCKYISSPSNSSCDEMDEIIVQKKETKHRSKPSSESESMASPPRKWGCFWWSPKKSSAKKNSSGNRFLESEVGWGKNKEFLSDLGVFSAKEQQRNLRKAMKEEEKMNREAQKIVKWAKQASARMNISDIEDELSDHEFKK